MTGFPKPVPGGRQKEKRAAKRRDTKEEHLARMVVFLDDERCRFPHEATGRYPCDGPDELMHVERTRAKTVNQEPAERHNPHFLMRVCKGHHQGDGYSYDGGIGGKGYDIEPLDRSLMYRGPCRFVDRATGELLGVN